jgi:acyl carrier protein
LEHSPEKLEGAHRHVSTERVCPKEDRFHMEEAQIYATLTEVFEAVFDEEIALMPELSAKDVDGWDSLTHIRLILTVEKRFKIKFSSSEIGKLENVGDLVRLLKQKAGG